MLLSSFGLSLGDSPPTHKAGNTLDLVSFRSLPMFNILSTPLHVSDHHLLSFRFPLLTCSSQPPSTPMTTRRNLNSLSLSSLSSAILSSLSPPNCAEPCTATVESATNSLLSSLHNSFNQLCPLSSRPKRTSPTPWLSETLRNNRRQLRAAERRWRKTHHNNDLLSFQSLLSKFATDLTSAKSSFYRTKFDKSLSNPRKLFATFSSLLKSPSPSVSPALSPEDFATFFEDKVATICSSFPQTDMLPTRSQLTCATQLHHFTPLSHEEVSQILTASNPTTCSLDPIPSGTFQLISQDLLPHITHIVNGSLTTGHVPTAFKSAVVTPILKKPTLDCSDINHYRPVSLLSFLSKVLERAVYNQLNLFLSNNALLDPHQSGFKAAHSTETALLTVSETLHTARSTNLSSVLILLDLSAAFDTVNHQILLETLTSLGISSIVWQWFASYLADRSFQVAWQGSQSAPQRLTTGVPQGSVLGPLLFSLYIGSLGKVIAGHGFSYDCYADDSQLIFSFPPDDQQVSTRISNCLADISSWMTSHHLKLNPSKTELLYIRGNSSPNLDLAISLDNSVIVPSKTARSLGVTLDEELSFSPHISNLSRSCRYLLYNIRRIRPFLTTEATQLLVQTLVISKLDYCNSLLSGLSLKATRPLQLIQNAAARLVFDIPKFSHTTPLLRNLHWLPVAARIRFKTLTLAFKAKTGAAPPYISALVKQRVTSRCLRTSSTARLEPPLLKRRGRHASRLFAVLAPQWWNELPLAVRTAETLTVFKRRLKTHFFQQHLD
uniref:Reverse transcriptase domain-containing protein n=1 Tax=Erpetoichthys calabaricus TaxID=27687 RepID=A0A8C4X3N7_ERPCA